MRVLFWSTHNARRIEAVGAGIAVLAPDAAALRTALQRVLVEPGFRGVARTIAGEIAALPAIHGAVDALAALIVP
jgi:UDP:flavonoid glycosyltransferase YjiC (YdhE family)